MAVALTHLAGRSIGVFGLARSGLATVRAAVAGGAADVFVWDDKEAARARGGEARRHAARAGRLAVGGARLPGAFARRAAHASEAASDRRHGAGDAGVAIVCDIELLWREAEGRARFVAITGTNGKSTTTALIGHVLVEAGLPVSVGGNIGRAALDLEEPAEGRVYVIEMSSYQLDLTRRFRPDVAVWLNLTPDHLDRHGDMEGYAKAKARIFVNMGAERHRDRRHRRAGDAGRRQRAQGARPAETPHRLGRAP